MKVFQISKISDLNLQMILFADMVRHNQTSKKSFVDRLILKTPRGGDSPRQQKQKLTPPDCDFRYPNVPLIGSNIQIAKFRDFTKILDQTWTSSGQNRPPEIPQMLAGDSQWFLSLIKSFGDDVRANSWYVGFQRAPANIQFPSNIQIFTKI